jgi:hypothetical protein
MEDLEIKNRMAAMRKRSGEVESDDLLVRFLYELMRDHVPPGIVEGLMGHVDRTPTLFTNGWLAEYAKDIAERLKKKD